MTKIVLSKAAIIEKQIDELKTLRNAAYATESDPLFFKTQRGEATLEEWQAKIAEIKSRYPYPEL